MIRGTVDHIENHGTIVVLWIATGDGTLTAVPMDASPFRWLVESRGADRIMGAEIECSDDDRGQRYIRFLDETDDGVPTKADMREAL